MECLWKPIWKPQLQLNLCTQLTWRTWWQNVFGRSFGWISWQIRSQWKCPRSHIGSRTWTLHNNIELIQINIDFTAIKNDFAKGPQWTWHHLLDSNKSNFNIWYRLVSFRMLKRNAYKQSAVSPSTLYSSCIPLIMTPMGPEKSIVSMADVEWVLDEPMVVARKKDKKCQAQNW